MMKKVNSEKIKDAAFKVGEMSALFLNLRVYADALVKIFTEFSKEWNAASNKETNK